MKVEIDSAALADAVAWTTRIIDARPAQPILSGVRLEAVEGTLQFSAFNYEISARHHIEAGIEEPGSALVVGKLLADITKSLPAEKTQLETSDSSLTITSGKSTFTLQLMPLSEYPDLPSVPPTLGQVDAPTFVQAVAQATVAVSREENRPVLTGVRIQFDGDKVVMTSTDRFRLSRSSFSWTPQSVDMQTVTLVRGSLLRDVSRALDEHQNVVIDFDAESPSLLGFENAGRVSTSQLIDGEFPAIDRLFADEYPTQAVIDKQALIGAIKRVALVAERNAPIRMEFNGQELLLSAGSADESQAREILDVDLDGEEITVAFNPAYLIEGLSAITEPFVRMKMTTAVRPVEFNGQQEADSDESMDYRYLLVPMRYNN
ncbi:DNA polymerase III subunit beta [Bifidobacterium tibiigranuli]|jgi:DNA polymerase-3 subunit beta|uniref:Beta sliding clamp n=1 Tax=Bifidobacterium tibiigranuli TaxID=2172043 RepID=A0A5N6S5T7_9BIFI|nr:DNA polymerase III subunit beta [Bifidobacterium tibiigranuli]KAE8129580.1 DNA polymerase III subunit beta [Bifidobacterium tibiigranuli]KAE8129945.1 DNA polymerase III subunit beta [Bifidobacterium tibiigranuli]MCH3975701.1 DNA polymerase III subunit beta [Bifidobacterium tibiigranuli]MCH4189832.1 DNA polymerase III subunit beta [Bifidobacterium tibiigranuli]MCH4202986.1 DNA polymerase III subunit beta [Bifidobacterium tibiigranuli]